MTGKRQAEDGAASLDEAHETAVLSAFSAFMANLTEVVARKWQNFERSPGSSMGAALQHPNSYLRQEHVGPAPTTSRSPLMQSLTEARLTPGLRMNNGLELKMAGPVHASDRSSEPASGRPSQAETSSSQTMDALAKSQSQSQGIYSFQGIKPPQVSALSAILISRR